MSADGRLVTRSGTPYGGTHPDPPASEHDSEPPSSMGDREDEDHGASTRRPSLKSIVYLFSQQFNKGEIVRFTGSGSKSASRAAWEKFAEGILVATFEYEDLFDIVEKVLRGPIDDEIPVATTSLKRMLYALLKTVTGQPASLVLTKPDISSAMDGVSGLKELRIKHEPTQKSVFRKSLIMDVVLFQLGESHPESMLMQWVKAIDTLKRAGCKTLDDLLKDILTNALTHEYSHLVTSWDEGGGVEKLDQNDMIKSIVTHFEHVIHPGKPSERGKLNSAYDRYREHTGFKPRNDQRGQGRGGKPRDSRNKRPPSSTQTRKPDPKDDNPYPNHRPSNKKGAGLTNAQRRQREKENEEKAKNTTCSACGGKGHSPSSPHCPKNKGKKKVRFEDERNKKQEAGSSTTDGDLEPADNDDGFYYIPPRNSGAGHQ